MIRTFDLGGDGITILRIRMIGRYPIGLIARHGLLVGLGEFRLGIMSSEGIMVRDGRSWRGLGSEKVAGRFLPSKTCLLF